MSVSNTGMACHIWAAGSGGSARRVGTGMTASELEDISNGIWMCYEHGKLVDTDEDTYSAATLQTWKRIAELRAKLSQQLGRDVALTPRDLAGVPLPSDQVVVVTLGVENSVIGDAVSRSCLDMIWGKEVARAARDSMIELTRNAFRHGDATSVVVAIEPDYVEVVDDGRQFDSGRLAIAGLGGGSRSLRALRDHYQATVVFRSAYESGRNRNRITFVRKPTDVLAATSCSVLLERKDIETVTHQLIQLISCETIYVVLPKYFTLSDMYLISPVHAIASAGGRRVVLVGEGLSRSVIQWLEEHHPALRVVNLGD